MELKTVRTLAVLPEISHAGATAFERDISAALADEQVRVLLVEGSGSEFCRGMQIGAVGSGEASPDTVTSGLQAFAEGLCRLAEAPKPTVAVVRGPALGGGLGIAAACDLVVASRGATFGLPEGLFGLAPAVIAPILLRRISGAHLQRLALTAESIDADEARAIGLVDEVVEDSAIEARVRRLCTSLSRVHPRLKGVVAASIRASRGATLSSAVQSGLAETTAAVQSADVVQRISRFLEGGAPWET